jgi:ACS family pantothenate transporter-like MFS transporter
MPLRWLFIIYTIITLPISIWWVLASCYLLKNINIKYRGFFAFPDVPSRNKPRLLTETDFKLAKSRLKGLTAPAQLKICKTIFKRVWGNWHWYFFCRTVVSSGSELYDCWPTIQFIPKGQI